VQQKKIECWSKIKVLFRAIMAFCQSLIDGALKLDYAIVIFVDPGVQINET